MTVTNMTHDLPHDRHEHDRGVGVGTDLYIPTIVLVCTPPKEEASSITSRTRVTMQLHGFLS